MTQNATATNPRAASDLEKLVQEIEDIPSIPETLIRILRVLDDPDSGPADLTEVVKLDAPLMAKILRLANSPYYTHSGQLADIHRCVSVLGYRTVRQMAICVSVATSLVSAVTRAEGRLDYRELWRHSVVTGSMARELARLARHPDPEAVFTAGLLHDVGKFILEIQRPEAYDLVIADRARREIPLVEAERDVFGYDHAVIGEAFGRTWRFASILTASFGAHHDEMVGGKAVDPETSAAAIVRLADYLANTMEPPRSDLGFDASFTDATALHETAGVSPQDVEENLDRLLEAVSLASAYLDLS